MHKTAQAWFTGGPSSGSFNDNTKSSSSPSLLAEWNAYAAASQEPDPSSSSFDLEASVKTTSEKTTGSTFSFSRLTAGWKQFPGSFQSGRSSVPSGKSMLYFAVFLAVGVFFIFIAFTMFLPVIVLVPQKFAICFTMGCLLIVGSFFALKGPRNQLAHMFSKERLPVTLVSISSMIGTIYVSMVLHSYILSVIFSVLQVFALLYYVASYFPGGSLGLKFISSAITSSILSCFRR